MYDNVARHAWSPPNFPHTHKEAKARYAPRNGTARWTRALAKAQKSSGSLSNCDRSPRRKERLMAFSFLVSPQTEHNFPDQEAGRERLLTATGRKA